MENFKHLFAIDLDGTLLTKTKKIHKNDLFALKKYHDLGGKIIIITGKGIVSGKRYIKIIENKLNIKLEYASFLAGSIIYDLRKNKIIEAASINETLTKEICNLCFNNNCNFLGISEIDTDEMYYMNYSKFYNFVIKKFFIKNKPFKVLKEYDDFQCYKINIFNKIFFHKNLNTIADLLKNNKAFNISKTTNHFYEITLKNINKESALIKICKLLKININDTAAIGDSANDIPMLKKAALSFGIDNKNNNFEKIANVIIKKNIKNPVAYAIKNYLIK